MKYTVEDMQKLAHKKGFEFISESYSGVLKKHKWMCKKGHIWMARPNNIMNGNGCPKCSKSKPRKTLEHAKQIGRDKEFSLVSKVFLGMKKKHTWECKNGHKWEATPESIKTTGCPHCRNYIQEERSRFIFEEIFNRKFPKNRTLLKGLELDGYCNALKLAFEYNGEHHYSKHFFNKNNLQKIRNNDIKKRDMCDAMGIQKIDIPYFEKDNLEQYIIDSLEELGFKNLNKHIDWSKFTGEKSKLNQLKQAAKSRKGKLLSSQYLGSHAKHSWKCLKCNYEWKGTARDVLKGSWCPSCANNKKYTLQQIKQLMSKNGFDINFQIYLGMNKLHSFICKNCNFEWKTKPNRIQQGAKCPSCKERR